jgi:ribulose-5-phosphate 4-epimerase/fuculose-1-phosphate aldolase
VNEQEARTELAYAYRVADYLGFSDFVFGHISLRCDNGFLIKKPFMPFKSVTPDNLSLITWESKPEPFQDFGFHRAILGGNRLLNAVMHVHSTAISVVAAGDGQIDPVCQASMIVAACMTKHAYSGAAVFEQQYDDLLKKASEHNFVLMMNHGLLTAGRSIGAVVFNSYLFEEACKVQVEINAGRKGFNVPEAAKELASIFVLLRKYQQSTEMWEGMKSCITL